MVLVGYRWLHLLHQPRAPPRTFPPDMLMSVPVMQEDSWHDKRKNKSCSLLGNNETSSNKDKYSRETKVIAFGVLNRFCLIWPNLSYSVGNQLTLCFIRNFMKLVIAIVRHHHHHTCSIYVSTCVNHFSSLFIIFNHVSQFCCFPEALNSLNLQKTSPNSTPRSARTSLFG